MTIKFCYLDFHAAVGRFIFSIISQNDYFSESLPKIFGAVVVTTQPVVHEVEVGPIIRPDRSVPLSSIISHKNHIEQKLNFVRYLINCHLYRRLSCSFFF